MPKSAILHTLLYADLFDYPLTLEEVQRYLIQAEATTAETETALEAACHVGAIIQGSGWFALRGRPELFDFRAARERFSAQLWPRARRWGHVLAALPFVRMVAVTGALAMNNVRSATDDVDYLIVTVPGRVWLARALCVGVVHLARRFGVELCPNYVLSTSALEQSPRNLYIAHELAQMVPLSGHAVYQQMRAANEWLSGFLPNTSDEFFVSSPSISLGRLSPTSKTPLRAVSEAMLSNPLGDHLEAWERQRKQRKFQHEAAYSAAAQLDRDHVKGHFNDHGARVLAEYEARLQMLTADCLVPTAY